MNVLEFLDTLEKEKIIACTAQQCYLDFTSKGYKSSYGYFRTQFNKHKDSFNSTTELKETAVIEEVILPIAEPLISLEVEYSSYQDADLEDLQTCYIPTGTIFDEIIATAIENFSKGGFVRQCVDMCYGKGGSGKTWSRNMLAAKAIELDPTVKACFISAEMRSSEYEREIIASPLLRNVDVLYLLRYFKPGIVTGEQYMELIRKTIEDYDIVIIDSGTIIQKQLARLFNNKYTSTELEFIFVTSLIDWVEKYNANVQCLSQAVKSNNYAGSTLIPHMVSSLSSVSAEGQQRVMMFEKNRNNGGTINRKLYFSKTAEGDIEFNEEAYEATYKQTEDKQTSMEELMNALHSNQRGDDTEMETTMFDEGQLAQADLEVEMEDDTAARIAAIGDIGDTSTGFLASRNPEAEGPEAPLVEFTSELIDNPLIS